MKLISRAVLVLCFLLMLSAGKSPATLYCDRAYTELTLNPGRPYNAVGLLNNGCTAFLIDANHILAAGHCFVNTQTGVWQTGLRFYPNFHPARVSADAKHVPRGDVAHAVVGSRTGEVVMHEGMDWGIARITNWKDTGGLDLTPLALYPSVPTAGMALANPAYTRHHFPYDDNDPVTWDNMQWDTTNCGWVGESAKGKNDGGMWAIAMSTAPIFDGVNRDMVGCNSRWGAGMIHADCSLTKVSGDVLVHNCDTIGGSSGSPIMHKAANGKWNVIGVGHGGGSPATAKANDFSKPTPLCAQDTPDHRDNVGASVERFRDAPRFASNVAVYRSPFNASATAVFAVDSDLNRVVWRVRQGDAPKYTSRFSFWKDLGSPYTGATKLTKIAACSADAARPEVLVIADSQIYERPALPSGSWGSWSHVGPPSMGTGFLDIDAVSDNSGRCQLFAVANSGSVFTRTKGPGGAWGNWGTVANGPYRLVTALNYLGTTHVAITDLARQIWRTSSGPAGWTSPIKVSLPPGVVAWKDIDMTWDEAARGFMLAVPSSNDNKIWFMPMYGSQAWSQWHYFETHLWAPGTTPEDAPNIQTISASRWMEDPAGTTSPVVFATDEDGNVYFIEYARTATPGWVLDWKSFYHEYIPYK